MKQMKVLLGKREMQKYALRSFDYGCREDGEGKIIPRVSLGNSYDGENIIVGGGNHFILNTGTGFMVFDKTSEGVNCLVGVLADLRTKGFSTLISYHYSLFGDKENKWCETIGTLLCSKTNEV